MRSIPLLALVLTIAACGGDKSNNAPDETDVSDDTGTTSADDTGDPDPEALSLCEQLDLPTTEFNPETVSIPRRHAPAGDFSVPLNDGSIWTLSEQWTGCESYIFLPHWLPVDDADTRSWWANGIRGLIERSPPNVHYFFVTAGGETDSSYADELATNIAQELLGLDYDTRTWWENHLHVTAGPSDDFEPSLIRTAFVGAIGTYGVAIDRFQKIRTLGSMADVDAYDANLSNDGLWPYERRIREAGYQGAYYNFEAEREERLMAEDATIVEVLTGDVVSQFEDGVLVLPSNIEDFDTLEIDVVMECPNTNGYELGNCGPWDYLAHMWLWEDPPAEDARKDPPDAADTGEPMDGADTGEPMDAADTGEPTDEASDTGSVGDTGSGEESDTGDVEEEEVEDDPPPTGRWLEMSRFITTYHRESRWVVDASHALAWLQEGGERTVRYEWAPSWNVQPTGVTTRFRFSNRGKGSKPTSHADLFTGGSFNTAYNEREPIEVEIPADATKVELVAIITGHGMATRNCAEFCDHSHHFTVGDTEFTQTFDEPGEMSGCADTSGEGTVPNQAGTWWYGRGGWCPGREVEPFVVDVTDYVTTGETSSISYMAKLQGGDLIDDAGNIEMYSWLVFHQ
ncbi:MAG: peptide-N-glycosidase F-related protein [Myxococcota bacterium]